MEGTAKTSCFSTKENISRRSIYMVEAKEGVQMKITYNNMDKVLTVEITEEVDHHTASRIRSRADFEIEKNQPKKAIFDFNNVTFMDSSGIGMIIGRYKLVSMFRRKTIHD